MKCKECNSDIQGDYCSKCGTKTNLSQRKLLGFRSNKIWKKLLSISYLSMFALMLAYLLFSGRVGKITAYDFWIDKAFSLVLCVCFISPYLFLSNTKFRNSLPLFKKHKVSLSVTGMAIVLSVFMIAIGVINSLHSDEYKADMENHAYVIENETNATCAQDGEISYLCEYCGRQKNEHILATGHSMVEISRIDATCTTNGNIVSKCEKCGEENQNELLASGHQMVEISRVNPTIDSQGQVVSKCNICGHTVTEYIDKLEKPDDVEKEDNNTPTDSNTEEESNTNKEDPPSQNQDNITDFINEESPLTYLFEETTHTVGDCTVILKKVEIVNTIYKTSPGSTSYAKYIRIQATVKNNSSQETYLTSRKNGTYYVGKYYGNDGETDIGWNNNYKWKVDSDSKSDYGWTLRPNQTRDICITGVFVDNDRLKYSDAPQIDLYFVNDGHTLTIAINRET